MARSKMSAPVSRVVGIDHISIRVRDYEKSKAFYGGLFAFLGFMAAVYALGWLLQATSG